MHASTAQVKNEIYSMGVRKEGDMHTSPDGIFTQDNSSEWWMKGYLWIRHTRVFAEGFRTTSPQLRSLAVLICHTHILVTAVSFLVIQRILTHVEAHKLLVLRLRWISC